MEETRTLLTGPSEYRSTNYGRTSRESKLLSAVSRLIVGTLSLYGAKEL
jgi:hypothetical protein